MPNLIDFYKGIFLHVIPVRMVCLRWQLRSLKMFKFLAFKKVAYDKKTCNLKMFMFLAYKKIAYNIKTRKMLSNVAFFNGLIGRYKQKLSLTKIGVEICFKKKLFLNKTGNISIPEDICKQSIFSQKLQVCLIIARKFLKIILSSKEQLFLKELCP